MKTISYTQARCQFKAVLDSVSEDADCTVITRRDAQDAVVMSLDHYNGLMETLHLLSTPANAVHLLQSIGQYRSGRTLENSLADD